LPDCYFIDVLGPGFYALSFRGFIQSHPVRLQTQGAEEGEEGGVTIDKKQLSFLLAAAFAWVGIYQLHVDNLWYFTLDAVLSSMWVSIALRCS